MSRPCGSSACFNSNVFVVWHDPWLCCVVGIRSKANRSMQPLLSSVQDHTNAHAFHNQGLHRTLDGLHQLRQVMALWVASCLLHLAHEIPACFVLPRSAHCNTDFLSAQLHTNHTSAGIPGFLAHSRAHMHILMPQSCIADLTHECTSMECVTVPVKRVHAVTAVLFMEA